MGYEYTVQGWCRLNRPADLLAVRVTNGGDRDAQHWARVTGRRQDHVLFATQGKWVGNYYVALMTALLEQSGGGHGLMTVTGEWHSDGKARVLAALDGPLFTLPIRRLYDPRSPWSAVHDASHYMRPYAPESAEADADQLRSALAGRSVVHGWVQLLYEFPYDADRYARLVGQVAARVPTLAGGLSHLCQYSEPYLLVGQDEVDAAAVVTALAALTGEQPKSYGLLYCGSPADGGRWQVPVMIEAGRARVLPAVSLSPADEADPGPARADAYEGLDSAFAICPVRFGGDLTATYAAARAALPADPVTAADDQPIGSTGYTFTAGPVTFDLTIATDDLHGRDPSGWPYRLSATMRHEADPDRLRHLVGEAAGRLAAAGVEVGPNLIAPDKPGVRQHQVEGQRPADQGSLNKPGEGSFHVVIES